MSTDGNLSSMNAFSIALMIAEMLLLSFHLMSSSNTVIGHLPHHLKIEDSIPANATGSMSENGANIFIFIE